MAEGVGWGKREPNLKYDWERAREKERKEAQRVTMEGTRKQASRTNGI